MVSTTDTANSLTVANTASGSHLLKVMTVVLLVFLPAVLVYQSWTYRVFRQPIR
jgi:cytochrome d ubiquinol oxidase subunit II